MANRWLHLPVFGAFALSLALTAPAFAQVAPRDGWNNGWRAYGYDNGYRAGSREGERDARDGRAPGFKRDNAYEDADWGFRGGDKDRYRHEFRRGYEAGYDTAYRRFARGGWYDNRPSYEVVVPAPAPAYPVYGNGGVGVPFARVAYDNGYRDGVEEGRRDFRRQRSFDPAGCDRFRDGDRGYDRRFGSRDGYRTDYRGGFRAGYAAGYNDRRDWRDRHDW